MGGVPVGQLNRDPDARGGAAAASRIESTRATNRAEAQREIDVTLWGDFLGAVLLERTVDPTRSFTPEGRYEPVPEYKLEAEEHSDRLLARSERQGDSALDAAGNGRAYIMLTVVFASALAVAGVGTKFTTARARLVTLGVATVILVVGAVVAATFPITF